MAHLPPQPTTGRLTLERAAALEPEIAARAPTWRQAARQVVGELGVATRLVIDATGSARTAPARAVQAIFLQASNDYLDLRFDAASGRGRPATRAARTLFEQSSTPLMRSKREEAYAERGCIPARQSAATVGAGHSDPRRPRQALSKQWHQLAGRPVSRTTTGRSSVGGRALHQDDAPPRGGEVISGRGRS